MSTAPAAIRERVEEALRSFGTDPAAVRDDATLEELDVDSLDVAELADVLRTDLGIDIEARDFVDVTTLGEAYAVIDARAGVT